MNVGFFVRHFTERGTEVAVFDYAKHNEELLNNKSIIICFTPEAQRRHNFPAERASFDKFNNRFQIVEIGEMNDMPKVIREHNLAFFYTLTYGGGNDIYQFQNKALWGPCKTIKHCVFETSYPESDFYLTIAACVNKKYGTSYPVLPHVVDLPMSRADLRSELGIPRTAVVYGRHGGMSEFNLPFAHAAIVEHLNQDPNCYFVFMNTQRFFEHPRLIHLPKNVNLEYKVKFINTCDAMIHARQMGETFGMSVAEFSVKNKPVITCPVGDLEHIEILGDKAVLYRSKDELLGVFRNIASILASRSDWNAHRMYTPEHVMDIFKTLVFDK
jgi:hypothetical protein